MTSLACDIGDFTWQFFVGNYAYKYFFTTQSWQSYIRELILIAFESTFTRDIMIYPLAIVSLLCKFSSSPYIQVV